jgi:hypothetical protein
VEEKTSKEEERVLSAQADAFPTGSESAITGANAWKKSACSVRNDGAGVGVFSCQCSVLIGGKERGKSRSLHWGRDDRRSHVSEGVKSTAFPDGEGKFKPEARIQKLESEEEKKSPPAGG